MDRGCAQAKKQPAGSACSTASRPPSIPAWCTVADTTQQTWSSLPSSLYFLRHTSYRVHQPLPSFSRTLSYSLGSGRHRCTTTSGSRLKIFSTGAPSSCRSYCSSTSARQAGVGTLWTWRHRATVTEAVSGMIPSTVGCHPLPLPVVRPEPRKTPHWRASPPCPQPSPSLERFSPYSTEQVCFHPSSYPCVAALII